MLQRRWRRRVEKQPEFSLCEPAIFVQFLKHVATQRERQRERVSYVDNMGREEIGGKYEKGEGIQFSLGER